MQMGNIVARARPLSVWGGADAQCATGRRSRIPCRYIGIDDSAADAWGEIEIPRATRLLPCGPHQGTGGCPKFPASPPTAWPRNFVIPSAALEMPPSRPDNGGSARASSPRRIHQQPELGSP